MIKRLKAQAIADAYDPDGNTKTDSYVSDRATPFENRGVEPKAKLRDEGENGKIYPSVPGAVNSQNSCRVAVMSDCARNDKPLRSDNTE